MTKKLHCIMLIDDDPATNLYHQIIIREGNWAEKTIVVCDGEEAIAYLEKPFGLENPKPNMIFLDINMPRMNGWEFLEEYKKLTPEQQAENIVIMLSTSCNPDDLERAETNPFIKEYRSKPLTDEILEELLATYWNEEVSC